MNTKTIARNSFWTAVEFIIDFVAGTATSIAVARALGPSQLGYYVYISWLTNISIVLGNVGVPGAAVNYMAEYLGTPDRKGVARTIFDAAIRIQCGLACLISAVGITVVLLTGDPVYRVPSLLLMLAIIPAMINTMPTNANIASENLRNNVPGSICSTGLYSLGVTASLIFGWSFTGIAASFLIGRTAECIVRMTLVNRWMRAIPRQPWPPEMRKKLLTFSSQNLVLMVLGVVVWDRSEIFFLKNFYPDVRHVAFYSLAQGTTENVLRVIRIFTVSASMTIRAQYGRDRKYLPQMLSLTAKYVALIAFPMYLGLAAVAPAAIRLAYGKNYLPAIPVLTIAAILAIPKAFFIPIQVFLQSTGKQGFLVRWCLIGGVVNLVVDWVLVRNFGSIGAAYGNGIAQTFTITALWIGAVGMFPIALPYRSATRFITAAVAMAVGVWVLVSRLQPLMALICGIPAGLLLFFILLRVLKGLDEEDRERIAVLGSRLPIRVRKAFQYALGLISEAPLNQAATGF